MMSREQPRPDTDRRWQEDAACKTRPDLNWFPGPGERFTEQRQVCASCPVQAACLAAGLAVNSHDDFGIWGGTSERQRSQFRAERRTLDLSPRGPAVCGTRSGYVKHVKNHEKTCGPCKAANAAYVAELKRRKRNATRPLPASSATQEAGE